LIVSVSSEAQLAPPLGARLPLLVGIAGLATFVLIVVSSFVAPPLWDAPGTHSSGARAAAYAFDNRTRIVISLFMFSVAIGIWLWFAGGLWAWMRRLEPEPQPLSSVFALSTVAMLVMIISAFVPLGVLGYRLENPSAAGLLTDTGFGLLAVSGIPAAAALSAFAALVVRTGCLQRWTAAVAVPAALAHVLIAMSFLGHGPVLSIEGSVIVWVPALLFIWLAAVSAALLLRER
jgi:hypothetical protein